MLDQPSPHDRRAADEAAIRSLVEQRADATRRRDVDATIALYTADVVGFELPPPLAQGPAQMRDAAQIREWFATWDGPILWDTRDLRVVVGGDVAYAHALDNMRGTKKTGEKVDLWLRSTIGLRREHGAWKIAHTHSSVPFYMDGSLRAAVDLSP